MPARRLKRGKAHRPDDLHVHIYRNKHGPSTGGHHQVLLQPQPLGELYQGIQEWL